MKKLMVLAVAFGMIFAGPLAFAGSRGWGRGMGPGYCRSNDGASILNLSEEQSKKLGNMRENYLKEITPLRNQVLSVGSELRLFWSSASLDRENILAKQKELSSLQIQLDEKTAQYRLDCWEVLTAEQQSKMVSFGPGMGRVYGQGRMHGGRW
jgi:Spy/CpxP family protein refolding chaperone